MKISFRPYSPFSPKKAITKQNFEMGTLTEEPAEEPHKSAWATALSGEVALIEFDGDDEEEG